MCAQCSLIQRQITCALPRAFTYSFHGLVKVLLPCCCLRLAQYPPPPWRAASNNRLLPPQPPHKQQTQYRNQLQAQQHNASYKIAMRLSRTAKLSPSPASSRRPDCQRAAPTRAAQSTCPSHHHKRQVGIAAAVAAAVNSQNATDQYKGMRRIAEAVRLCCAAVSPPLFYLLPCVHL